ncbi:hypothetical protein BgiBS90_022983, partial [Biomphalaria glabrata]
ISENPWGSQTIESPYVSRAFLDVLPISYFDRNGWVVHGVSRSYVGHHQVIKYPLKMFPPFPESLVGSLELPDQKQSNLVGEYQQHTAASDASLVHQSA